METDPSGRAFTEWPRFERYSYLGSNVIWPGTPTCLLVKNQHAIINTIQQEIYTHINREIDLNMRGIALKNTKMRMLAVPQLCTENQQGAQV
ncbi:Hypothetical protein POVN_LOCUS151 [uncultured virus]|nr:Hypothetical protein POVN_LOCUS151 [uncultured virus]